MGVVGRRRAHLDDATNLALVVTRFWSLVDKRGPDQCWEWQGDLRDGYGTFYWQGRMTGAHELAVTFTTGERRGALDTCHSCDNPPCCNPAHLRFGTRQDNVDDCTSRDRHARGDRNGHARVTEAQVVEIRYRRAAGAPFKVLARDYDLSVAAISAIVRGDRWAHVDGPTERLANGRPPTKRSA